MAQARTIQLNPHQIARLTDELREIPKAIPRAIRAAINKTAAFVKTKTLRAITADLNVKRKDIDANKRGVNAGVKLTRAAKGKLRATVEVTGDRIPLVKFARNPQPNPGKGARYKVNKKTGRRRRTPKGKQVRYRVFKGKKNTTIPDAFVAEMKSGHVGIFKRPTDSRLPLQELFGPSVPHVAEQLPELKRLFDFDASAELEKNLASQVDRFLDRPKTAQADTLPFPATGAA